ncbi:putative transcription factor bHLH family [Helianthus annuus]|nr:putative transcription factor bHLH family [Helianthus annuus]KAJ0723100.1 putative transcription factor bHLH family [Helianthus annuus]KAJ0765485.1 putative transcription factor bHLH family [Helianthus annuus]
MSPPQQPTSINPNSLKIRLAYRFLHNLNNLNTKRSNLDTTQIRRSHRVKLAAYASMAYVVGSRRAWSRAILWKIRNRAVLARFKRVDHKITTPLRHHHVHAGSAKRRTPNYSNPKREYSDPFGNSGQEVKLRKLVPGSSTMDALGLLDETADYIKCLATQVEVMKNLVDLYSII